MPLLAGRWAPRGIPWHWGWTAGGPGVDKELMSRVLLRWVLVALLLPALGAPRGLAWAWCLCVEALCGCCEAPAEPAQTGCCAPGPKADGEEAGGQRVQFEPVEECGACGRWEVDVQGLEALVPPVEQGHGPLLAAGALQLAPAELQTLPTIARERARGPPLFVDRTGLRPGALPLRI